MKLAISLAILFPLLASAQQSLLRDPQLKVRGSGPPAGFWSGVPAGKGGFEFRNENGDFIAKAKSDGVARLQLGTAIEFAPENPPVPPGTLIRFAVEVRGNVTLLGEGGQGAVVQVIAEAPAKGASEWLAPQRKPDGQGRPQDVVPTTGEIPWMKLESIFALPENTRKLTALMYLMNSEGELEWKNPSLAVAGEGATATADFPKRFQSRAEIAAERTPKLLADYEKRWAEAKSKLGVPEASELYAPNEKLTGPHPRYLFAGTPLEEVKRRYTDPAYAKYADELKQSVLEIIAEPIPAKPNLDAEDPLRSYAEKLAPLALYAVLEPDATLKTQAVAALEKWVNATLEWGLPLRDLPLSQQIFGLGAAYDWLFDELSPEMKAKIRAGIVERARWMRDPANESAYMWRGTQFTANHNWFNYGALAMAAAVLWGETETPLEPGEPKLWMDEAMQNFVAVDALQPTDGGAMEGFLYQDYGLRPYFDFAVLAEQLTEGKRAFVDNETVRNLSTRVFSLLPGNIGFFTYGDSEPRMFGGSSQFRYIASRLDDRRAQLLAQIMEDEFKVIPHVAEKSVQWRSLFWFDPKVEPVKQAELPLHHDQSDLGVLTARSAWDASASFFGLVCGPFTGTTASSRFGYGYANGHVHPDKGNFSFYYGPANVIPGSNYARTKLTTHHNLVVFEGRDKQQGQTVGQLGGNVAWFGMALDTKHLQKPANVTDLVHKPEYHSYLCDLGGIYMLDDAREPGGKFFPTYLRSITYLTNGAVVIVDKIECPQPRTFHFRLLTAAEDLKQEGREFSFTVKGVPGKIIDLSAQDFERSARKEENYVWRDKERDVAILTAKEQTKAIFATVLGMNGAEKGIAVTADEEGVTITGAPGGEIKIAWETAPPLAPDQK